MFRRKSWPHSLTRTTTVSRAAAKGTSYGAPTPPEVELAVQRQDERRVLGDPQIVRADRHALSAQPLDLVEQRPEPLGPPDMAPERGLARLGGAEAVHGGPISGAVRVTDEVIATMEAISAGRFSATHSRAVRPLAASLTFHPAFSSMARIMVRVASSVALVIRP